MLPKKPGSEAFAGGIAGIEKDENGEWTFNKEKALAGMIGVAGLTRSKTVQELSKKLTTHGNKILDDFITVVDTGAVSKTKDGLLTFKAVNGMTADEVETAFMEGLKSVNNNKVHENLESASPKKISNFFKEILDEKRATGKARTDALDPTNYKSAEEFVKAQGNKTYYHTTSTDVAPLIEKDGFKAQVGERTMGTTQGNGVFFYEDVSPTVNFGKNFTWKGKEPTVVEAKINGKIYNSKSQSKSINALAEDTGLIEQLKADGFVGIRGTENGTPVTFVFEPSAVKNKSQLTEIWNKANQK